MNKIEKVRALLRLAHDQAGRPEGESARLHALQMMGKYGITKEELGEENYKVIEQIRRVQSRKGIQASMPFEINIH